MGKIKKKIGVFELHFHFDSLDGFIKIFENSNYELHVFTTKSNLNLLRSNTFSENIIFHPLSGLSKFFFIRKHINLINTFELIFINTIANDFGSYLALPKKKIKILRIHNINKQFNPNKSIYWPTDLYTSWKFTSYFFRQIVFKLFPIHRRIINKRIDYFTFPDDALKSTVIANNYINPNKIIYSIPLKVSTIDPNKSIIFDNVLNVTIIGSTDPKRRDYEIIIQTFEKLFGQSTDNIYIKLTLLGKTNTETGKKIVQKLKNINPSQLEIISFSQNVDENEFIQIMNETHLVISPIIQDSRAEIYHEYYGKTKTSGSILDFIKFGIVTLVPNYYNSPIEMKSYIEQFNDATDLAKKISYFYLNFDKLEALNKDTTNFVSSNFNKSIVFQKTDETFKQLLNSK